MAWAVLRLVTTPGRLYAYSATVSRTDRGMVKPEVRGSGAGLRNWSDFLPDERIENMRMEIRIRRGIGGPHYCPRGESAQRRAGSRGMILMSPPFTRTAMAIWDAVEPIIRANPNYLCRAPARQWPLHMFYRMANESSPYTISRTRR